MKKATDFTGREVGMLTVIERGQDKTTNNGQKIVQWKCVCKCGKVVFRRTHNLLIGSKSSCKNCKHKNDSDRHKLAGDINSCFWNRLKHQARKYDI